MSTIVLDWYGLSERQVGDGSMVLGGSGTRVVKTLDEQSLRPLSDIRWESTSLIIVALWGTTLISEIINTAESLKKGCDFTFVGLIRDQMLCFRVLPRFGPQYDEDTDEFIDGEFKPREYHGSSPIVVLPWSHSEASIILAVLDNQGIHLPIYCVLDKVILQFSHGLKMRNLIE